MSNEVRERNGTRTRTSGKGSATFDFLGFTLYYAFTRDGHWQMMCKTRRARLRKSIQAIADWCRRHRHLRVKTQDEAYTRQLQLLWRQWQLSEVATARQGNGAGLVQMASPSEPTSAPQLGAIQDAFGAFSASTAPHCGETLGVVATRHFSGGAGWWKSPCPDLARASREQSLGATLQPDHSSHFSSGSAVQNRCGPPIQSGCSCLTSRGQTFTAGSGA